MNSASPCLPFLQENASPSDEPSWNCGLLRKASTMRLDVWLDRDMVGWLTHDNVTNRFSFEYTAAWATAPRRYPLSPSLPLVRDPGQTDEMHSALVRRFFDNLLPEGDALDHAAQAAGTSRSNLVGLIIALGKETAGALRIVLPGVHEDAGKGLLRLVTTADLSTRIRQRNEMPFSVWDGKVRLSIAGYQDKIAVYEKDAHWYLVEGPRLASTVIIKPVPVNPRLATLPDNEYLCMQLAQRAGLSVAPTRLVRVPEAVLLVTRFDRMEDETGVRRLHVIDGCQALGMSGSMKYERAYGDGRDVKDMRDGVTLPKLFGLLAQSPQPARDRQALLNWAIFQVLIGNTDAHGKNVSFYCDVQGLRLAPAYDLICTAALKSDLLSDTYAMAIGDAFREADLTPFEWANFAAQCGLPIRLVSQRLGQLALRVRDTLDALVADALSAGVDEGTARTLAGMVAETCKRQIDMAPKVDTFKASDF